MQAEQIQKLAKMFDLGIKQKDVSYEFMLPSRSGVACQVTIGPDALEWYISVISENTQKIVYKDWCDYLGYDGISEIEALKDKEADLHNFIGNWINATAIRIKTKRFFFKLLKEKRLELLVDNSWIEWWVHTK